MGRGLRRYRCKACRKTFNATTGTSLHGLHKKDRWLAYRECLADGMMIRDSAKRCKLAVSTSFRWRHRFWAHRIRTLQISRALSRPMKPMSSKAARGVAILTGRHAAGEARPASGACQMNRFRYWLLQTAAEQRLALFFHLSQPPAYKVRWNTGLMMTSFWSLWKSLQG